MMTVLYLTLTGRKKNILLLGVDASENPNDLWSGTRTDTIILLNVDPRTKSVNAISIPRDSKVFLPGDNGIQKINAAHAIGGVDMTVKTVEHTLGVKVDKYIMVHDSAVKAIVEALGGIDVYVEKDMRYHDWAGHLHIDLKKGYHHLTPNDAVGYLRFRHDPMGDIGRTQRQQWFLRGLLTELKKPETVTKIPDIVGVAKKYIKTDMSMYDLTQFAMMTKNLDMDKIEIAVLPGAPNKHGVVSYWILDPEKTQEVVNRLIYRRKPHTELTVDPTASIIYTDGKTTEAHDIMAELKEEGVIISCETRISKAHSQFIAHSPKVTNEYFNSLKKSVKQLDDYQFVYDPSVYMCGETDFTIVVSSK
jgi:LCP family protein required for cell wall assembly